MKPRECPSSPGVKTVYDALGRVTKTYITDRGGDAAPGATGNYADAAGLAGDTVLEETETRYVAGSDLIDLSIRRVRAHDAAGTGPLSSLASANSIVSYVGTYYDAGNRPIRSVAFGTNTDGFKNGGSAPTINQSSPPDHTTPGAMLVTATFYNDRGLAGITVDPEGQRTTSVYDDLNRRVGVIENSDDGVVVWDATNDRWKALGVGGPSGESDTDRVTTFTYDDAGRLIKRVAFLTDTTLQETIYEFGVDASTGSGVASNDLLRRVRYPDQSTGAAGSSAEYFVDHSYNRLGELTGRSDQNGVIHAFTRDGIGRVTMDSIVSFGAGNDIDQRIDAIQTEYDSFGRRTAVRSLDATTIVNEVKFEYDARWRVVTLWQDHDSAVTQTGGNSAKVVYTYDDTGADDGNYTRLASITYPDGAVLASDYGAQGSLNHVISRVGGLTLDGVAAVSYEHIGHSLPAVVEYPEPGVLLDRSLSHNGARTPGEYPGYDPFGRIARQVWADSNITTHSTLTTVPNIPPIVEFEYAYDKSGNRTMRIDARPGAGVIGRDELYLYDGLDRLAEARRGQWDGAALAPAVGSRRWSLDPLGNWDALAVDLDSPGAYDDPGDSFETRVHNLANEIVEVGDGTENPGDPRTFDAAGNIRTSQSDLGVVTTYTHDAWNRLVRVAVGTDVRSEHEYNGLNWRVVSRSDADGYYDGVLDRERVMIYDLLWRLIEERIDDDLDAEPGDGFDRVCQQVWGARHIDDAVLRRENRDFTNDGAGASYESTWYYVTDALFGVVAVIDGATGMTVERVRYLPYGGARHSRFADIDGDGATTGADQLLLLAASGAGVGEPGYLCEADLNRDGVVNFRDNLFLMNDLGAALPAGRISAIDSPVGFAGYIIDDATGLYAVRNRTYGPGEGRWMERDPAGYVDGSGLYEYVQSSPINHNDPTGLSCQACTTTVSLVLTAGCSASSFFICGTLGLTTGPGGLVCAVASGLACAAPFLFVPGASPLAICQQLGFCPPLQQPTPPTEQFECERRMQDERSITEACGRMPDWLRWNGVPPCGTSIEQIPWDVRRWLDCGENFLQGIRCECARDTLGGISPPGC